MNREVYLTVRFHVQQIQNLEYELNEFPTPENYERQAQNWIAFDEAMKEFWDEAYNQGIHDESCDLC